MILLTVYFALVLNLISHLTERICVWEPDCILKYYLDKPRLQRVTVCDLRPVLLCYYLSFFSL
jgi:hypothetical protein